MIEDGIHALLSADAGVVGVVGNCIFPVLIPIGSMPTKSGDPPCLSYQVVTTAPHYTLATNEYESKRIQFDAWAMSYKQCKAAKQAIRRVLDGYRGILPEGTRVLSALRVNETDFWEEDPRVYRALSEYIFTFVEP